MFHYNFGYKVIQQPAPTSSRASWSELISYLSQTSSSYLDMSR